MKARLVTVFGGSGFIGRYVVERLAARGDRVRVAVRHPGEALFLKTEGDVGQIQLMAADILNERSVARAVRGADVVINLVGILYEDYHHTFDAVQAKAAGTVAHAAAAAGARAFVHMSAIGADADSLADYARTKGEGEAAVRAAFPGATIIRPSLVIGPEDGFFNRFADLAAKLPLLPLPGTETRFQPVYVGDVADAIVQASLGGKAVAGETFELGGPQVMTLRQLLEFMMGHTGVRRPIIRLPWGLAMLQATFLGLLPTPPLTRDQVRLLKVDNVVTDGARGLKALGIRATPMEAVLPRYFDQYRVRGQFGTE
ncbi:MAG: complex I NDUFA9 subunit family protein [Alphaproteobacteria bacterium]|nr:MAG: complex I NDUFA9 subunit family protein [Alphaproteobacteria bacterium]